jgi:hypothetical protein
MGKKIRKKLSSWAQHVKNAISFNLGRLSEICRFSKRSEALGKAASVDGKPKTTPKINSLAQGLRPLGGTRPSRFMSIHAN